LELSLFLPLVITIATLWVPFGEHCGNPELMRCTSAGLVSQEYIGALVIDADITVTPAQDSRFWAGLALNHNIQADDTYIEAVIEHGIAPYNDDTSNYGAILATPADHCCNRLSVIDTTIQHHLHIEYNNPRGIICVDDKCDTVTIDLGTTYQVELLCVGVNPGESGSNIVGCSFTNIIIANR